MKSLNKFWKSTWTTPALFIGGIILGAALATAIVLTLRPPASQPASSESPAINEPSPSASTGALSPDTTDALLTITWHGAKKITDEAALGTAIRAAIADPLRQEELFANVSSSNANYYGNADNTGFWDLGTVEGGAYDGAHYVYWLTNQCNPGGCDDFRLLISSDKKRILLLEATQASGIMITEGTPGVTVESLSSIIAAAPNLKVPSLPKPADYLTLENGRLIKLNQQDRWYGNGLTYTSSLNGTIVGLKKIGRTREGSDLYTADETGGCVFIFGNDGMPYSYSSLIPTKGDPSEYFGDQPIINWNEGITIDQKFTGYRVGGCGLGSCSEVVSAEEMGDIDSLQQAGTTTEGDPIFISTYPANNPLIKTIYDTWMPLGENGQYTTVKPDFSTFMEKNPVPVFFWKDGFGRWVRYLSSAAIPPGECGKPVIYLYPEKTTDVSVRLPSFINVTVSDPSYPAQGWHVTAQPNGQLTDARDGKTYGSLYWEGTGVYYATPNEGWVIKDGDVESFLTKTLPRYGLNEREAKDFMEFWVPKMSGAPYYRVSFLTSAWNQAAPLYVSPRPQSVIRLFMDWRPLPASMTIAAPKIETPARDGFTLVEWGGTLWK